MALLMKGVCETVLGVMYSCMTLRQRLRLRVGGSERDDDDRDGCHAFPRTFRMFERSFFVCSFVHSCVRSFVRSFVRLSFRRPSVRPPARPLGRIAFDDGVDIDQATSSMPSL